MDSFNNIDFKKLANQQRSVQMKKRLLALAHLKDGHSRTQIAKFLKVNRTSVNKWGKFFSMKDSRGYKKSLEQGDLHF
ncbi:helix-turn-helix domain-containing protein [Vibrio kanaloae]|uniref:helix-turn-helix domain-containing protein n=2 Tax=Vibrio kanaloae TaxID=170673 RepID=UPI003B985C29